MSAQRTTTRINQSRKPMAMMGCGERRAELVDLCGGSSSDEESDGSDLLLQTPAGVMVPHPRGDLLLQTPHPQKRRREGAGASAMMDGGGAEPPAAKARRRSTQSCKQKGRRLQKAVVKDILLAFPALHAADVKSCAMGSGGEDVQLSAAARAVFPFSVEVKNRERLNVHAALAQAEANAGESEPLLVFSKNRAKTWAAVQWPTLLRLLAAGAEGGYHRRLAPRTLASQHYE